MRRLLLTATVLVCVFLAGVAFADHYWPSWHDYHDSLLLTGIETIPDDAIVLSKAQTRRMFVVSDVLYSSTVSEEGARGHNAGVREAACLAFILPCDDYNDILTTPFTFLGRVNEDSPSVATSRLLREIAGVGNVKIVTASGGVGGQMMEFHAASMPWLMINGAGNTGFDNFFADLYRYDRDTDTFVWLLDEPILPDTKEALEVTLPNIRDAVEANTVIYASGYHVEGGKPYKTDWLTGCIGVEESCVYVPGLDGTSYRSPPLGSALASLLSVFPDYDVFDLARLTSINGCAKQYPTLPGGGIVDIPCMIETICAETNSDSSACDVHQRNRDPVVRSSRKVVGLLENPLPDPGMLYSNVSGLSAISGWVCDAEKVEVEIEGFGGWGKRLITGYGTTRVDTKGVCGDDDNGFSFLFNWNLLGDGVHTVKVYADGEHFGTARVKVLTLGGNEFVRDIQYQGNTEVTINSREFSLMWEQSLQNFIITDGAEIALQKGFNSTSSVQGYLENPSLGSHQSGISAISGWVCDAEKVEIEFGRFNDWGKRLITGYGTTRVDTRGVCGDDDNGFSFLFNWNLLGDGVHTVRAYADNVLFAETQVKVTVPVGEFLRGHSSKVCDDTYLQKGNDIYDFCLEWWETQQNFVLVNELEYQ